MDNIKCELIGGGSPKHLNTFSNLIVVAVHYTHIYAGYVLLLVDSTHVHQAVYCKIIRIIYNIVL